jgi:mannonate dehydratase
VKWAIKRQGKLGGFIYTKFRIGPNLLKKTVEDSGLSIAGIESVNIHDSIKVGSPERDAYIANYCITLINLGEAGLNLVCYNFMVIFDWTQSDLTKKLTARR